jgi:hypothetical protein
MLTASDLDAPARLLFRPLQSGDSAHFAWDGAREFGSLREAVHTAMTEDAPAGQEPYIRTGSGKVLEPATLQALFDSLQGP